MASLAETTLPSIARRVVIVCKSEKKWTEHRFVRLAMKRDSNWLVFACCVCEEERVYGLEERQKIRACIY